MRKALAIMTLALTALLAAGCASGPEVFAGYDSSGNARAEPLREVVPRTGAEDPEVTGWVNNLGSGMEGTVTFMRAIGADGTLVLDRAIDSDADSQTLPAGSYTLSEYWRDCGGNCDYLGPARLSCSVDAVLAAGGHYRLTLHVRPQEASAYPDSLEADCTLTQP